MTGLDKGGGIAAGAHHAHVPEPLIDALQRPRPSARLLAALLELGLESGELGER
jgi:hypothetical protein